MSNEPASVLKQLSERFKGKLAPCRVYDANVCTTRTVSDRPWELIPVSGKPFSRRLRFIYRERKVTLFENGNYVHGRVEGTFSNRPFTINAEQKVGPRSQHAGDLSISHKAYPVFTEDGRLSSDHKDLLGRSEFVFLVQQHNLQEGESLHFSKGEMGFYLRKPSAELVGSTIDRMIDLAREIEAHEVKPNLKVLPVQFHPLISLIERWGIADDLDRADLLDASPKPVLEALIVEVDPYLTAIDSYLDSFGEGNPTEEAAALARLAECALEAKRQVGDNTGQRKR